jgi:type II secretory pathway predicted ATPase ExeA
MHALLQQSVFSLQAAPFCWQRHRFPVHKLLQHCELLVQAMPCTEQDWQ